MYPPAAEVLAPATPAQKAAKAAKMVGYLGKTPEKVNALVKAAQAEGIDAARVEIVSYLFAGQCNTKALLIDLIRP